MASVPHSPLNDTHLADMRNALAQIAIGEHQIMLAKQAGVDVSVLEKTMQEHKQRILQIKNTYFPGQ